MATKTDIRVLYTDIRSIIISYLSNLKAVIPIQHNLDKLNDIKQEIDLIKSDLRRKCEQNSFEDLSNLTLRLRQELTDIHKKHKNLCEEFVAFSKSMQVQKTHFQLEVLERRLGTLESKIEEEMPNELDFSEILKNSPMSRAAPTPRSSLRLTDIIDRTASLGSRARQTRFNTIVKSKKLS